jgi:mRNA-degrading endonuclease RelE of RelBE toxin-antitoxin system
MKGIASPQFLKKIKKLTKQDRAKVGRQIQLLLANPTLGEEKQQDLKGVFVRKFKMNRQETLLSYQFTKENLFLITVGTHENYYRDLKKYLK